jgi:hypothetical protein
MSLGRLSTQVETRKIKVNIIENIYIYIILPFFTCTIIKKSEIYMKILEHYTSLIQGQSHIKFYNHALRKKNKEKQTATITNFTSRVFSHLPQIVKSATNDHLSISISS